MKKTLETTQPLSHGANITATNENKTTTVEKTVSENREDQKQ